jgi:hypothetical protein
VDETDGSVEHVGPCRGVVIATNIAGNHFRPDCAADRRDEHIGPVLVDEFTVVAQEKGVALLARLVQVVRNPGPNLTVKTRSSEVRMRKVPA